MPNITITIEDKEGFNDCPFRGKTYESVTEFNAVLRQIGIREESPDGGYCKTFVVLHNAEADDTYRLRMDVHHPNSPHWQPEDHDVIGHLRRSREYYRGDHARNVLGTNDAIESAAAAARWVDWLEDNASRDLITRFPQRRPATVLRSALGDATNNGASKFHDRLLIVDGDRDGDYEGCPTEVNGMPVAVVKNGPADTLRAVPLALVRHKAWVMFGGNFVTSCDSRWAQAYGHNATIAIFDRVEA